MIARWFERLGSFCRVVVRLIVELFASRLLKNSQNEVARTQIGAFGEIGYSPTY